MIKNQNFVRLLFFSFGFFVHLLLYGLFPTQSLIQTPPEEVRGDEGVYEERFAAWSRYVDSLQGIQVIAGRNVWYTLFEMYDCVGLSRVPFSMPHDAFYFGDGVKWICPTFISPNNCIVYSFGINGDVNFEISFLGAFPQCTIIGVDPTDKVTALSKHRLSEANITLLPYWIVASGKGDLQTSYSIRDLASKYGHNKIDLIKMDIESSEWDVFANLDDAFGDVEIGQVAVEIHVQFGNRPDQRIFDLVKRFHRKGFGLAHVDANEYCETCRELLFVNRNFSHRTSWTTPVVVH